MMKRRLKYFSLKKVRSVITKLDINPYLGFLSVVAVCIGLICLTLRFADEIDGIAPKGTYYDCRMAEISPDFPVQVKEQCRQLRKTT